MLPTSQKISGYSNSQYCPVLLLPKANSMRPPVGGVVDAQDRGALGAEYEAQHFSYSLTR